MLLDRKPTGTISPNVWSEGGKRPYSRTLKAFHQCQSRWRKAGKKATPARRKDMISVTVRREHSGPAERSTNRQARRARKRDSRRKFRTFTPRGSANPSWSTLPTLLGSCLQNRRGKSPGEGILPSPGGKLSLLLLNMRFFSLTSGNSIKQ